MPSSSGACSRPNNWSARECFDYGIAHPGQPSKVYEGTDDEHCNEYGNPANVETYLAFIKEVELHDFVASLWDSQNLWFLGEELFIKSGGKAGRSPWHQDTSYMPANGPHLANIWISFDPGISSRSMRSCSTPAPCMAALR